MAGSVTAIKKITQLIIESNKKLERRWNPFGSRHKKENEALINAYRILLDEKKRISKEHKELSAESKCMQDEIIVLQKEVLHKKVCNYSALAK